MTRPCELHLLPLELVTHILCYIDVLQDYLCLPLVSKTWRSLHSSQTACRQIVKTIRITKGLMFKELAIKAASLVGNVSHVIVTTEAVPYCHWYFDHFVKALPNHERVILLEETRPPATPCPKMSLNWDGMFRKEQLGSFSRYLGQFSTDFSTVENAALFKNLRILALQDIDVSEPIHIPKSTETLVLSCTRVPDIKFLVDCALKVLHLRDFTSNGSYGIVKCIVQICVKLSDSYSVAILLFFQNAPTFESLEDLSIDTHASVPWDKLNLERRTPKLRRLAINAAAETEMRAKSVPNWDYIEEVYIKQLLGGQVSRILRATSSAVRSLRFRAAPEQIHTISGPKMEYLAIEGHELVSIRDCPALRCLNATGQVDLSDASLPSLISVYVEHHLDHLLAKSNGSLRLVAMNSAPQLHVAKFLNLIESAAHCRPIIIIGPIDFIVHGTVIDERWSIEEVEDRVRLHLLQYASLYRPTKRSSSTPIGYHVFRHKLFNTTITTNCPEWNSIGDPADAFVLFYKQ